MRDCDLFILGSSAQLPTRFRNHGAYLFRWNGEGMLFDPGEGTQRQFIFANVAPTTVNRIFISHFHGDHCLGVGSMLMRLNIDKVKHPIHCYYPASGQKYFRRLRFGTIYHDAIEVVEHPVSEEGIVHDDGNFCVSAHFLDHGVDSIGWRVTEADRRKFDRERLKESGVHGPAVSQLTRDGRLEVDGRVVTLDDVSFVQKGDSIGVVLDTRPCAGAVAAARGAKVLLCESTFQEEHADLARRYHHMTTKEAAGIAKEAGVKQLILTHFSGRYREVEQFGVEAREVFPASEVAEDLKHFTFKHL